MGAPDGWRAIGHAHHHTGAFQVGYAGQQSRGLGRGPAQGMKNLPGIDHVLEPAAAFRGTLNRHEQRQQSVPFAAPAYSRKAWPSGTCWALACADSRVV